MMPQWLCDWQKGLLITKGLTLLFKWIFMRNVYFMDMSAAESRDLPFVERLC